MARMNTTREYPFSNLNLPPSFVPHLTFFLTESLEESIEEVPKPIQHLEVLTYHEHHPQFGIRQTQCSHSLPKLKWCVHLPLFLHILLSSVFFVPIPPLSYALHRLQQNAEQGQRYEDSLGVMLTETEHPGDTEAAFSYPEVVDNTITLLYVPSWEYVSFCPVSLLPPPFTTGSQVG